MGWIIVWSYMLPAIGGGIEFHSMPFGGALGRPYTTAEACEQMAVMAPLEPNLHIIEPRLNEAVAEDFTCTWVEDYLEHTETP